MKHGVKAVFFLGFYVLSIYLLVSCTFCSFFMACIYCYSTSTRLAIATKVPQRGYFGDFLVDAKKSLFSILPSNSVLMSLCVPI